MHPPTTLESKDRSTAQPRPAERPIVKRRRSYWWVWLLIFGGLGYGAFRYFQDTQAKQKQDEQKQARRMANRPVPVVAAPAHRGDVPVLLRGLGTVTAFNTVTVKSRVDGPLVQVLYREGQFVKKGDVLAEIDPRPFQVALEQAQGQMARDQAQLKDAQVNLARYQALWQEQVIAKQQLDTQAATVGQFKGTLEADQAAINNAQLQLSFTKITSPLSGRIGLRLVDVGNIVHTADQNGIAVITQLEPISVIFTIPADNLPPVLRKLRAGAALPVEAYDRDDKNRIATGTLLTVDNQIDTTTGTSRLKAVFDNRDGALFPNQFVNCRLRLDTLRGVVIVPSVALETGPKGSFVFGVTPDGKAAMRQVATGPTEGDNTVITSGLNAGEMVVIDGQDKLQDGARVDARGANGGAGRSGGRRTGGQGEIGRGTKGAVRPNTPPTPAQEGVQGQGPRR